MGTNSLIAEYPIVEDGLVIEWLQDDRTPFPTKDFTTVHGLFADEDGDVQLRITDIAEFDTASRTITLDDLHRRFDREEYRVISL
jgi:hypothetical protein